MENIKQPGPGGASAPTGMLPNRLCFGWGIGTLGMSLMFSAVNLLLLRYLVDYVGIAAALAGVLIGLSKIYDAVTDPLMGTISDRTRSSMGRRRPFLILGGLLSAASFVLLFNLTWIDSGSARASLALAALLLNATGYTIFNVPYLAMPAEMTSHPHDRTRLMSFRVGAVAVGQLVASSLGPLIIVAAGAGIAGHATMAWVMAAVIAASCAACFLMTREAASSSPPPGAGNPGLVAQLRTAMSNRPFTILLGVKLTQLFGLSVFIAVLPFLFTRVLQITDVGLGLFFLWHASAVLLSQPFWVGLSRRQGKKAVFYVGALFWSVAQISWLWAGDGTGIFGVALRGALAGLGTGGLLLAGQALLPDTMEYDFRRTGLRREGVLAGVYTTVEKAAFALGPAFAGIILGATGYVAMPDAAQPAAALLAIKVCTTALPVGMLVASCLLLRAYRIPAADVAPS